MVSCFWPFIWWLFFLAHACFHESTLWPERLSILIHQYLWSACKSVSWGNYGVAMTKSWWIHNRQVYVCIIVPKQCVRYKLLLRELVSISQDMICMEGMCNSCQPSQVLRTAMIRSKTSVGFGRNNGFDHGSGYLGMAPGLTMVLACTSDITVKALGQSDAILVHAVPRSWVIHWYVDGNAYVTARLADETVHWQSEQGCHA
jgi:hypothetical protein